MLLVYILLFPLSPTRLLPDCVVLFALFFCVLCLLPNVSSFSCVRMRFYVVGFLLYILSYCYLYVLSPFYGVRYNFRNKLSLVGLYLSYW